MAPGAVELSGKQKRFIEEYLIDFNGRQAAMRAGYSAKTAEVQASRLLRKAKVAAAVEAGKDKLAATAGVTAERVIAELARIGFADIRQVVSWRPEVTEVEAEEEGGEPVKVLRSRVTVLDSATLSDDTAAAVAEVSQGAHGMLRIKMHDKPGALEKLGRVLGIFKDKIEHTGKDGAPLERTVIILPSNDRD